MTKTFYAHDIKTGRRIREATEQEISAYRALFPTSLAWALRGRAVVGEVAIEGHYEDQSQLDPSTPLLWH